MKAQPVRADPSGVLLKNLIASLEDADDGDCIFWPYVSLIQQAHPHKLGKEGAFKNS